MLELTALPSIDEERWVPLVRETDVLLVAGGDALYLCHWMRQSGLADLLPSLRETVWVGLSGGSMVMTPCIGEDFVGWKPPTGGDRALGVVDFSIFPHVDHEDLPSNTMANAERWAAGIPNPAYAIDDQTAIKVSDGYRRRRFRGALEAVYALTPCFEQAARGRNRQVRNQAESAGTRTDAMTFLASGRNALSWAGPATSSTATNRCCLPP